MTTTRSNAGLTRVLELPGHHKASRKLELAPNASAYQKRDYFLKVFKDPPNAEALMQTRVISGDNREGAVAQGDAMSNGAFRLLQFNASCTNCENIFRAVVFIYARLREKAHLDDEFFQFGFTKDSPSFKDLATELRSVEPSLRGVTPQALISLYDRIIKERKALDDFLAVATGFTWTDTRMSDMAREIVSIDKDLREREFRQQAAKNDAKRHLVTDADAAERQLTMTKLGTLTRRKRALEGDAEEEGSSNASEPDDDATVRPRPPLLDSSATTQTLSFSDARQHSSRSTGSLSTVQLNGHKAHHQGSLPESQLQSRRISSTSESTDEEVLQRSTDCTLSFNRPSPRSKRRLTTADTDRLSALAARVDELEAQNRQLKMGQMQSTQSTQRLVSSVDDELVLMKRKDQQLEEQFRMLHDRLNLIESDNSRIGKRLREVENKVAEMANTSILQTSFP